MVLPDSASIARFLSAISGTLTIIQGVLVTVGVILGYVGGFLHHNLIIKKASKDLTNLDDLKKG